MLWQPVGQTGANRVSSIQIGDVITLREFSGEKFVVEAVRQGGMGRVFKLLSVRPSSRPMALKTYLYSQDQQEFDREARAWSALSGHPHIAELLWFGRWQSRAATVGPWYPKNLREVSFADDPGLGLSLIVQLIGALVYAIDESGILHRDIKPSNVLIDSGGNVRVSDFGLAAAVQEGRPTVGRVVPSATQSVTGAHGLAGTGRYMAPELFTGAQPSVTTEIYALGVTVYEFVTGGEHPYVGPETGGRFVAEFRTEPLKRIAPLLGTLGRSLREWVAVEPTMRPRAFRELTAVAQIWSPRRSAFDISVQAATLRKQGRLAAAQQLLSDALEKQPRDPVLLNGLSLVLSDEGQGEASLAMLRKATEALQGSRGQYNGDTYVDPAINLARKMIHLRLFDDAADLLIETRSWMTTADALWFAEFGWIDLWQCNFDVACEWFSGVVQARQITDDVVLEWFVLSAHLAHRPVTTFVEIGRRLIGTIETARVGGLALLVSNAVPPRDRVDLINSIPYEVKAQLGLPTRIVTEHDKAMLGDSVVLALLRSIEDRATGGRFSSILERPPGLQAGSNAMVDERIAGREVYGPREMWKFDGDPVCGSVESRPDGQFVIRAVAGQSPIHGMSHIWLRTLPAKVGSNRSLLDCMIRLEEWAGVVNGRWTGAQEERVATQVALYFARRNPAGQGAVAPELELVMERLVSQSN